MAIALHKLTGDRIAKRAAKYSLTADAIAACCGMSEADVEHVLRGDELPPMTLQVFISLYGCATKDSRRAILRSVEATRGTVLDRREWRGVPDCSRYEVSSDGRVRRIAGGTGSMSGLALKPTLSRSGHSKVTVYRDDGRQWRTTIHRLVALAFKGLPPPGKTLVCHLDGDPTNNRPENLYWGTYKENSADAIRHASLRLYGVRKGEVVDSRYVRYRRRRKVVVAQGVTETAL